MPYEDLVQAGRLRDHGLGATDLRRRVADLLAVARRNLSDAAADQLSLDARHNLAYDAVRAAAEALMAAEGYRRGEGPDQHVMIFEFLAAVEGGRFAPVADRFNQARRLRNKTEYDLSGIVSAATASALGSQAQQFIPDVVAWLRATHPELMEPEQADPDAQ